MNRRSLDIVVISDVHLGTYECHAKELLKYLRSIKPGILVLNGDFIDTAQLRRESFPKTHMQVICEVINLSVTGTNVYYITGNRDDLMRRFSEFSTSTISLRDKLVLQLKDRKYWIFHGDVFDASLRVSPWLTRLGSTGYNMLLRTNRLINKFRRWLGKDRMSYAGKIKTGVKQAVQFVQQFEKLATRLAAEQGYDSVICGHIHQPVIKDLQHEGKTVMYMNSGDWVENLTALEYRWGNWSLYEYDELDFNYVNPRLHVKEKPKAKKRTEGARGEGTLSTSTSTDAEVFFEQLLQTKRNGTFNLRQS